MRRAHPTSGLPVSLEEKLRHLLLWLIPIAATASLISWFTLGRGIKDAWTAYLGLPLIAGLFVIVWVLVLTHRLSLQRAQLALVGFPAVYMVANEIECALSGVLYSEGDPIGWLWMPVLYVLTFLILDHQSARWSSWIFLGVQIAVYLLGLLHHHPTTAQLHYALQYFVTSGIYVCVLGLYSELKKRFGLVQSQAETDALTGLINRRHMQTLLEQAVLHPEGFSVLLLDLDHFKHINDRYGHNVGDLVLCEISRCMEHCLRQNDLLCRWGGEEFLLLLPKADLESALGVAERILTAARTSPFVHGIALTVSIGAALYEVSERPEDIVHRADVALYKAKQQGRDQIVLSSASRLVA